MIELTFFANKKTLLHSAAVAVCAVLCCTAHGQAAAPSAAPATNPAPDTKAGLNAQEQALKAQHAMAVTACAQTLAPAQCTRQAGLVHKQALHGIKKRRDVLDTQTKQAKHAQHLAAKATSQAAAHSHAQAAQAQGDKRLVKQQAPKPDKAPMAKQQRPKNTANADGKANPARSPKPLTVQPSAEQRRANVAKAAEKEKIILARKDQAKARQAKRAAKSANKAAKDKAALEQAANGGG